LRLLTNADGSSQKVIDIALASGFDDVTSFNRAFRRHFNCTPTEARSGEGATEYLPTPS
jgi:AraC-like DNA-binding protein